jgi:hypothetical protein
VNGPAIVYVCIALLWIAIWIKMARDEARAEEEPRGPEAFFD